MHVFHLLNILANWVPSVTMHHICYKSFYLEGLHGTLQPVLKIQYKTSTYLISKNYCEHLFRVLIFDIIDHDA